MAFSFRKIISNISYFTKSEGESHKTDVVDEVSAERRLHSYCSSSTSSENIEFDRVEADSTSKCVSLSLTESVRNHPIKNDYLSDTLTNYTIKKGSLSDTDLLTNNIDRQNKKCQKLKHSDTDISIASNVDDKAAIKMCRKVDLEAGTAPISSVTPESFADVEVDKNEEERITLLVNYQMKFDQMESFLKKLLTEFQFHIEVSKVFNGKSIVTAVPGANVTTIPKSLGEVMYVDLQRGVSPAWNIIMEKEDSNTKSKLKTQLLSMRQTIDNFVGTYLNEPKSHQIKRNKLNDKKRIKHFDFPDLRDAMLNLFHDDFNSSIDDLDCSCRCHSVDSGLISKSEKDSNHSITSSIGNFSLDSTTLSAYSESLDQVISYNSFHDTSLYSTLLQRAAIERITFYIQVHSIQLKCESPNELNDSKNVITFYCSACNITEFEENGLLKHILSPSHCEKIHFVYKTAYVKKCISAGKEIQPSTVLNPMTMYRDENKIVCFGDALYACSLCFENLIVGESVLMAHCHVGEHVDRRERLAEIFE
ncbi:Uncharacterized protein OBRU01_14167 [Operophtera brumata]|uniref:Uncharacterized protein n=1 Tax=Operophtera brumata TaxID=104452 RepID=A0A0L7L759_OPEBR|nr:Uncharacterized protein OBRU01_14167 [Operophtera brumata]